MWTGGGQKCFTIERYGHGDNRNMKFDIIVQDKKLSYR